MKGKKGEDGIGAIGIIIMVVVAALVLYAILVMGFKGQTGFLGDLSKFLTNIFNPATGGFFSTLGIWISAVKDWLFAIAVPTSTGLSVDQQVIAFAVFLLMVLVGTMSLKNTMNGFYAFALACLVGVIASRSLTASIVADYISGSPVASAIFLVGIIPILAFYGAMKKFGLKAWSKFLLWILLGVIYIIAYNALGNPAMGSLYAVIIIIAGCIETVGAFWRRAKNKGENKHVGSTMRKIKNTEVTAKDMVEAYDVDEDGNRVME